MSLTPEANESRSDDFMSALAFGSEDFVSHKEADKEVDEEAWQRCLQDNSDDMLKRIDLVFMESRSNDNRLHTVPYFEE